MNNRTPILLELQDTAPGLLQAPVAMPYTFPPDYFSNLSSVILGLVNEEVTSLTGLSKETPYQIPAGYFDQFAQSVFQKLGTFATTLHSKEDFSFLSSLPKQMLYKVPTGYFETLPAIVLEEANIINQQTVPEGYFESLPDILLAKIRQSDSHKELEEIAPVLNTISKKPVQHVPAGYFENQKMVIQETKAAKTAAPVVSIQKKTGRFQYAVAAALLAILISFGVYFLFNNKAEVPSIANQPTITVINNELASLDTKTIENYLQTSPTSVSAVISIDELNELNNSDLDELLESFTDQQLKKHIEETPELPSVSNAKKS